MKTMLSKKTENRKLLVGLCLLALFWLLPAFSGAQEIRYKLLQPLPISSNQTEVGTTTSSEYFSGIVTLIIAFSLILAVIRIIYGGIKYMSTDAFQGKSEARGIIENALIGFVLVAAAWLIVSLVNPNLTSLDLNIEKINTSGSIITEGILTGTPEELGCYRCEEVTISAKQSPEGCSIAAGGLCYMNTTLQYRLGKLIEALDSEENGSLEFIVTESFPPTRIHQATCHQMHREDSGTCVDIALEPRSSQTVENIKTVIEQGVAVDLRIQFEVLDESRAEAIRTEGEFNEQDIVVVPGIDGEHFSVYLME